MAPSDCAASIVAYSLGRLAPITTMCSPRERPAWCRPQAISSTSAASADQDSVCQIPYSFSRMAAAVGRWPAWCSSSWGKLVSMSVFPVVLQAC